MERPTIFIASSSESLDVARAIEIGLHADFATVLWKTIFHVGDGTLERLTAEADRYDFAAVVLGKDDSVTSRGFTQPSPRDNVLFELGLFTAAIGKHRTFFVVNQDENVKIPSDFSGITLCGYFSSKQTNLQSQVSPACSKIINQMLQMGGRKRAAQYLNPHYDHDLTAIDGIWKPERIANQESVVIVIGNSWVSELLDREAAGILQRIIDSQSGGNPFRRAIILPQAAWDQSSLRNNPVISIGGDDKANPLKKVIVDLAAARTPPHRPFQEGAGHGAFVPRTTAAGPKVALWGPGAIGTRQAVESWIKRDRGLLEFLGMVWPKA